MTNQSTECIHYALAPIRSWGVSRRIQPHGLSSHGAHNLMKVTSKQARVIHDIRATEYDSFFFFFALIILLGTNAS